ncbi:MAG: RDD family protein [Pelagibacterales bacterium]|nr:RDD family protein [Pelagibacterales bacterium]
MVMNTNFLENIFEKKKDSKFANSTKRSIASAIDVLIVLFLRGILLQLFGMFYLQKISEQFSLEFQEKFGTESLKRTPEHISFLIHHKIFYSFLLTLFIIFAAGALYYALLNSSPWKATIGKRIMKIMIVDKEDNRISFYNALFHYFLSALPIVFVFYLLIYQEKHHLSFFEAISGNNTNLILGFIFLIWTQLHMLTKSKTTAYDLICQTFTINGKSEAKFPWNKVQ